MYLKDNCTFLNQNRTLLNGKMEEVHGWNCLLFSLMMTYANITIHVNKETSVIVLLTLHNEQNLI